LLWMDKVFLATTLFICATDKTISFKTKKAPKGYAGRIPCCQAR